MKKILAFAAVALVLTTAAYAMICTQDCSTCTAPCEMKSTTLAGCGDAPKCDPNSQPAPKCGGDKPKCDPNSQPTAKCGDDKPNCGGCKDPNKPACPKK